MLFDYEKKFFNKKLNTNLIVFLFVEEKNLFLGSIAWHEHQPVRLCFLKMRKHNLRKYNLSASGGALSCGGGFCACEPMRVE